MYTFLGKNLSNNNHKNELTLKTLSAATIRCVAIILLNCTYIVLT